MSIPKSVGVSMDAFVAAQFERPHVPAYALLIDSRASFNNIHAFWAIRMCYFDLGGPRHGWGLSLKQTGSLNV